MARLAKAEGEFQEKKKTYELEQQAAEDIKKQEAARKEKQKTEREAEQKAKVEAEEFVLTGSEREADQLAARGQEEIPALLREQAGLEIIPTEEEEEGIPALLQEQVDVFEPKKKRSKALNRIIVKYNVDGETLSGKASSAVVKEHIIELKGRVEQLNQVLDCLRS